MKLYNLGMVIGRFQVLHKGHVSMIKHALEFCDQVVVYLGSSQESRTTTNPFNCAERIEMFREVFAIECACKKLLIRPLPDIGVGNSISWGTYVLSMFKAEFHRLPDLYVSGCEKERASWFTNEMAPNTDELRMTRKNVDVSGTECRQALLDNDYEQWCQMVPYELFDKFEEYKNILKEVYNG